MIHFETHDKLSDEPPNPKYLWLDAGLDETSQGILAALLPSVFERAKTTKILYGILYDDAQYFLGSGAFNRRKHTEGLTCATFILAIFRRFGHELIEHPESWPLLPEDTGWQHRIIDVLASTFVPARLRAQNALVGKVPRFRTEQVVVAVAKFNGVPLTHAEIAEDALELEGQVASATPIE